MPCPAATGGRGAAPVAIAFRVMAGGEPTHAPSRAARAACSASGVTLLYVSLIICCRSAPWRSRRRASGREEYWRDRHRAARAREPIRVTVHRAPRSPRPSTPLFGLLLAWVLVALPLSRPPPARCASSTCPSRCRPRSPAWRSTTLFGPNGWFGRLLEPLGIKVAYTPLGIMRRHGLHQPALRRAHRAAGAGGPRADARGGRATLGARPWQIFAPVICRCCHAGLPGRRVAVPSPAASASSAPSSSSPATSRFRRRSPRCSSSSGSRNTTTRRGRHRLGAADRRLRSCSPSPTRCRPGPLPPDATADDAARAAASASAGWRRRLLIASRSVLPLVLIVAPLAVIFVHAFSRRRRRLCRATSRSPTRSTRSC